MTKQQVKFSALIVNVLTLLAALLPLFGKLFTDDDGDVYTGIAMFSDSADYWIDGVGRIRVLLVLSIAAALVSFLFIVITLLKEKDFNAAFGIILSVVTFLVSFILTIVFLRERYSEETTVAAVSMILSLVAFIGQIYLCKAEVK